MALRVNVRVNEPSVHKSPNYVSITGEHIRTQNQSFSDCDPHPVHQLLSGVANYTQSNGAAAPTTKGHGLATVRNMLHCYFHAPTVDHCQVKAVVNTRTNPIMGQHDKTVRVIEQHPRRNRIRALPEDLAGEFHPRILI